MTEIATAATIAPPPEMLYTPEHLSKGYDRTDPQSFARTRDFRVFRDYIRNGGPAPVSRKVREEQALHDVAIADALAQFLAERTPRLVGVMGGHSVRRDEQAYRGVATLARRLAARGFVVVTGGGPGLMEAAHLGATFGAASEGLFEKALRTMEAAPDAPDLTNVIDNNGEFTANADGCFAKASAWINAAVDAKALAPASPPISLAIPTWRYGGEPTMPLATFYAKYFQNSLREEALIQNARAGVIYGRGGGGTVREIFEDAEQNYYADDARSFVPMIFFDREGYWERNDAKSPERSGVNLKMGIVDLIRYGRAKRGDADACLKKVLFTTDMDWIIEVIEHHSPIALNALQATLAGNPLDVGTSLLVRRP